MTMEHRHAFLIMAHDNWYTLGVLLKLIDAPWADIYLHIDKKAEGLNCIEDRQLTSKSRLYLVKSHNVTWGNESQIKAEMELFKIAYKNGPYWYYHFLSGNDLPLKSSDELYAYFDNKQDNFLQILPAEKYEWRLKSYINIFRQSWIPVGLRKRLNVCSEILQYKLHTDRLIWLRQHYPKFAKGHNWCDLTEPAVKTLIEAASDIRKFTRFTHCSDELYKQIILVNNQELSKTISPIDIRKIDWEEGAAHPKTYTIADFDELVSDDRHIFARKFNDTDSRECVDKIFDYLRDGTK